MAQQHIQPSFSAGEVSPSLYGRVDIAKYAVGTAVMENFFVDYRGGATNRAGLEWVGYSNDPDGSLVRLIPFQFNTEQTYILEFGQVYMRVIMDGGYVLETGTAITGITQANPASVTSVAHGLATGDQVYISGVTGMTQVNNRTFFVTVTGVDTFTLQNFLGTNINSSAYTAYSSGGLVEAYYRIVSPFTAADLPLVKYSQSADIMTMTHPSYAPQELTRTGHAAWAFTSVNIGADINAPTGLTAALGGSAGSSLRSYVVTAVNADGQESIASLPASVAATSSPTDAYLEWTAVTGAVSYNIYKSREARTANSDGHVATDFGYIGTADAITYTDDPGTISPDFSKTPPLARNPFAEGAITSIPVTSGGSLYDRTSTFTVSGGGGTGAIIKAAINGSGAITNIIIVDGGSGYSGSPTVVSAGAGSGLTTGQFLFSDSTGLNPACNSFYQQRRVFGASNNAPETLWFSKTGDYDNFDVSFPLRDDDGITATLVSQQVNAIKSMIQMPGGLVCLTAGGAWQISGGQAGQPLTPASINAQPQAHNGSTDLMPILINYNILYVQDRGNIVRDLSYNFYTNIYTGTDLTILSNHMFLGYEIVDWTWQEEPFKILWTCRDDGAFLSLTYLREQEIFGWARHWTQGQMTSTASIVEGEEVATYFVVEREYTVGGVRKNYKFIERMASRVVPTKDESFFLDAAYQTSLTYPNASIGVSASIGVVTVTAIGATPFVVGDIGKVFRAGRGKGIVTGYTSSSAITVTLTETILNRNPVTLVPYILDVNEWSMTATQTVISGLDHLEGRSVSVLGDGVVLGDETVVAGVITIDTASSLVLVGLPYYSRLQTLRVDLPGGSTVQDKRKNIPVLQARTAESVAGPDSFKVGATFTELFSPQFDAEGVPLSGQLGADVDIRAIIGGGWDTKGQYCVQQNAPYPVSVLATIPEILVGDTRSYDRG